MVQAPHQLQGISSIKEDLLALRVLSVATRLFLGQVELQVLVAVEILLRLGHPLLVKTESMAAVALELYQSNHHRLAVLAEQAVSASLLLRSTHNG
ncbi:hypothetical protein [Pantoea agglomerans]|uniref:hypothetical protein n=1 Tax=Enterobacter agglomerans TaxID=549 RepID=UPI000E21A649|nr:hypothetical protein [Pantoea agglomerans]MCH9406344.1 hypothetical protein [Pantoea agglomerans]WNK32139.1 hypothetical protein RM157_08020 [Pantoea agglomerans]WNK63950.1 hypothetical protein RM152_07990 [Pantoea agglomerans]